VIDVISASYGRHHSGAVCKHPATSNQKCHSKASLAIVKQQCQGKTACKIKASNGVFGDPCGGTFKYLTAKYQCVATASTKIRFENDSPKGDRSVPDSLQRPRQQQPVLPGLTASITYMCSACLVVADLPVLLQVFIDDVRLREGHGWTVDAKCEAAFAPWALATPTSLAQVATGRVLQYKISYKSAYYITPPSKSVWNWNKYQAVDGDYVFVDAEGVQDSFACSSKEMGTAGIGCSNGGGKNWKVMGWDTSCVGGAKTCKFPAQGRMQICQDHPDAFQVGACALATVSFRHAPATTTCHPDLVQASWPLLAANSRVVGAEEDRLEHPWEWRNNEMSLEQCRAECNLHSTCIGIEFQGGRQTKEADEIIGCEHDTVKLSCASGVIDVISASYGRHHSGAVCKHPATSNQKCHSKASVAIVKQQCQGKKSCAVKASNGVFGDPCGGTFKYLTANYRCVGIQSCIMIRQASSLQPAPGFSIYGRPGRLFELSPPPPPPTPVTAVWPIVSSDERVADMDEDRAVSPWEWRSGQFSLSQCKGECVRHTSCLGIEFKQHNADKSHECILLRRLGTVGWARHYAAGWVIYSRPSGGSAKPPPPPATGVAKKSRRRWKLVARQMRVSGAQDLLTVVGAATKWTGVTLEQCKLSCDAQPMCQGVQFQDAGAGRTGCSLVRSISQGRLFRVPSRGSTWLVMVHDDGGGGGH
jgi:ribosomal protein L3